MLDRVRLGRAGGQAADERNHFDGCAVVGVEKTGQGPLDRDVASELLLELADQRGFNRFVAVDLAAGEFPFERKMPVQRAPGHQDAALALDQRTNDGKRSIGIHPATRARSGADSKFFFATAWIRLIGSLQLSAGRGVLGDMKALLVTCLKVLLVVALGLVVVHVWPMALVPLVIGLLLVLGLGLLLLLGLMAAVVVLLALLSPVWIPLAAILGIIWLVKKLCSARHGSSAAV